MDHSYFFCPRRTCRSHRLDLADSRWYQRYGFHDTKAFGRVQRYRCNSCGATFSDQTFLLNYWLKKYTDFSALGRAIDSSASGNFVARNYGLSAESLRIRQDRLARNSLFLQTKLTEGLRIDEPLVADGLESFVASQFFPISLNILIGKHTQFLYYFTESHSRRKGRITEAQRTKQHEVYKDKSFRDSRLTLNFEKLLNYLDGRCAERTVQLYTDEHPIYRALIAQRNRETDRLPLIDHYRSSSTLPRTTGNALFAVNYFDRLIRKDVPNHRRETICFGRNDRNLLSRFAYYAVTHNFYKPFRVSSQAKQSERKHSDGVIGGGFEVARWKKRFHEYRFFHSFVQVPEYFEAVWFRRTPTPLRRAPDPVPAFAYQ